jgi:ubiquilin
MSPEQVERLLENPMFVSQLTEFMNSPQAMQLMEPMFNENPQLREMMRNPEIRRMLFSPESIRTQIQISRMMGNQPGMGMGGGARGNFPAPGVTDNATGANQPAATGESNTAAGATAGATPANPFAALFGGQQPGGGAAPPAQSPQNMGNQFALLEALLGGQNAAGGAPAAPSGDANSASNPQSQQARDFQQQLNMLSMLGGMGGAGAGGLGGAGAGAGAGAGGAMPNYADLFGLPNQSAAPADTRPPEERFAEQLRQLNEMGFYDFDRNVEALRRSGGNVQGAIEHLLSG